MSLFGKKPIVKSEEEKKAKALGNCKRVQFQAMKLNDAEVILDYDINLLQKMEPVNYYARKLHYLQCSIYYNDDYSEIYAQLQTVDNDKVTADGKYRRINAELFRAILRKFGQNINLPKD